MSLLSCTPTWPGVTLLPLPQSFSSPLHASLLKAFAHLTASFFSELSSYGVDISTFQNIQEELTTLPGKYSHTAKGGMWFAVLPHIHNGALLKHSTTSPADRIVHIGCLGPHTVVGCIALRDLNGVGEVKRMYVDPEFRGGGVGSLLLNGVEEGAKALGYKDLYLDTLARLESACALYKARGYELMPPYNHTPVEDVLFFKKSL